MSKTTVEALVGKAMLDNAFRQKFLQDPQAVAHSLGYHLTDKEVEALKASVNEFREVGQRLSDLITAPGAAAAFVDIHV